MAAQSGEASRVACQVDEGDIGRNRTGAGRCVRGGLAGLCKRPPRIHPREGHRQSHALESHHAKVYQNRGTARRRSCRALETDRELIAPALEHHGGRRVLDHPEVDVELRTGREGRHAPKQLRTPRSALVRDDRCRRRALP